VALRAGASSAPATTPNGTRSRCIVPTAPEPAPTARKAERCPDDPGPKPQLARGSVRFPEAPGEPRVTVELARAPAERERGLMYRTSMARDEGMLFSWHDERVRSFWMRNTCIPLDMLFVAADGTIVGILEQVPTLNESSRTIPCPAAHVLELNAGWCRQRGVVAGQRLRIEP
jgi:hypothetical protein